MRRVPLSGHLRWLPCARLCRNGIVSRRGTVLHVQPRAHSVSHSAAGIEPGGRRAIAGLIGEDVMMEQLPHHYRVTAAGAADGAVELQGDRLPVLRSASPSQFGGPGNLWSPETLLVAALADCFILTFRAIARASKLSWLSLEC